MIKNKKLNKRQYAYKVIRSRILDGTYVPGQRIIIDQIAKEVQSSHIPVREAIHQLESEQLIEYEPNIGAYVKGIDETSYATTLEVLAVLEGYATAISAPHIDSSGIQKLTEINEAMRQHLEKFELDQVGDRNRDFHFQIYSYCPNELLVSNIQDMWERMDIVRLTGFRFFPERTPHSIVEHAQMIKFFEEKANPETIEKFTRTHKLNTLKAFKLRNK
ncbi:MAG TPA: GntR family transcriptional regulator [Pseudogracilibacillus sp.]|nr:GntR family transcriptional regulator [Pseudogracilibacillus sp.]